MGENVTIIGGADGPTTIFMAGELGVKWLNIFGLIIIILILIPNVIYAVKFKGQENKCKNVFVNVPEQIGRYGCMFLMVFNIGIAELGFGSVGMFLTYLFGNVILIVAYWVVWALYFKNQTFGKQLALAIIPTAIFLLCGITMRHWLLIVFGVIFGVTHIYVTSKNRV